jgi:hypothetical protein
MNVLFDLAYDTQQSILSLDTKIKNKHDTTHGSPVDVPKAPQSHSHSSRKSKRRLKSEPDLQSYQNVKINVSRQSIKAEVTPAPNAPDTHLSGSTSNTANNVQSKAETHFNHVQSAKMKPIDSLGEDHQRKMKEWEDEMREVLAKQRGRKAKANQSQPFSILHTTRNPHLFSYSVDSTHLVSEEALSCIAPDHCHNPDRPWTDSEKRELVEWTFSRIEGKRLGHKRFKKRNFHNLGSESPDEFHYVNVLECQSELHSEDYQYLASVLDRSVPSVMAAINFLFTPHQVYLAESGYLFNPLGSLNNP